MLESRFVGALFVAPDAIRRGIGRALLDEVKQHYARLSLEVYQKNESAVSFYHAQGFRIEDCAWQDDTQHPTDYALAGGSNAVSGSAGPVYFSSHAGRCSRHSRCPAGMSGYLWLRRSPPRFCRCPPPDPCRATPFMQAYHPGRIPPSPPRRPAPDRGRSTPAPDRHRQSPRPGILRMNSQRFASGDGIAFAQRGVVQLTVQTVCRMGRQQLQLPRLGVAMPLVGLQPHRVRRAVGVAKGGDGRRVDLNFTARRFQRVGGDRRGRRRSG